MSESDKFKLVTLCLYVLFWLAYGFWLHRVFKNLKAINRAEAARSAWINAKELEKLMIADRKATPHPLAINDNKLICPTCGTILVERIVNDDGKQRLLFHNYRADVCFSCCQQLDWASPPQIYPAVNSTEKKEV